MDIRIHPAVSDELVKSTDLTFDKHFVDILNKILTKNVLKELCEERYRVLMESIVDRDDDITNFEAATQKFMYPDDIRTKKTFISLILCYASVGVIPVTQSKLGEAVEQFIKVAGGWKIKTYLYADAMKYRMPGSFENGKRG